MARIGVQSEELRQQASTVKAGAAEVNDILGRLTGQIQTLASTWEGAASAAFQTRWQEWQAGAAQAVNIADFRSAVQAYESVDAARSAVYDNASTVSGIPLGRAVELAAGAAPGWVGDALSVVVDKVSDLDSFRDDQPDPDVIADELSSTLALDEIARHGPAGGNPKDWEDALQNYRDAASLGYVDVDHANPEPRTPLDSALVDEARRSDRYGQAIPWPLAIR